MTKFAAFKNVYQGSINHYFQYFGTIKKLALQRLKKSWKLFCSFCFLKLEMRHKTDGKSFTEGGLS